MECYTTTEQRARGLRQWIQMVIDQIINKDLDKITRRVSKAGQELREERIRLMKVVIVICVQNIRRGHD